MSCRAHFFLLQSILKNSRWVDDAPGPRRKVSDILNRKDFSCRKRVSLPFWLWETENTGIFRMLISWQMHFGNVPVVYQSAGKRRTGRSRSATLSITSQGPEVKKNKPKIPSCVSPLSMNGYLRDGKDHQSSRILSERLRRDAGSHPILFS